MFLKLAAIDPLMGGNHNEYVRYFTELGMAGSVILHYLNTNYQVSWSYRKLGEKGGDLCLALGVYIAVIYLTDQVYEYTYMAFAAILMCERLAKREKEKEKELEEKNRMLSEEGLIWGKQEQGKRNPG